MAEQVPSIGRVVHFVASDGEHVPAIIARVNDDGTLNLFAMDSRTREKFEFNVVQTSDGSQPFSWHWPEYVPAKS